MFYFARCINIVFNSLLAQLVKYDVHTTRKIKFMHAFITHNRVYVKYVFYVIRISLNFFLIRVTETKILI